MQNIEKLHRLLCKLGFVLGSILCEAKAFKNGVDLSGIRFQKQPPKARTQENNYQIVCQATEAIQLRSEIVEVLKDEFISSGDVFSWSSNCEDFYKPNKTE